MADYNSLNPFAGTTVPGPEPLVKPEKPQSPGLNPFSNTVIPSIKKALDGSPDEAAKNKKIAAGLGVPVSTVELDPASAQKELKSRQTFNSLQSAPITQNWFSDPNNAAVAVDDVETLRNVEKLWSQESTGVQALFPTPGADMAQLEAMQKRREIVEGKVDTWGLKGTGEALRQVWAGTVNVPIGLSQLGVAMAEMLGLDTVAEGGRETTGFFEEAQRRIQGEREVIGDNAFTSGLQSAGQVLGLAYGGAGTVLTGAIATTTGSSYEQARQAGLGPYASMTYGSLQGFVEGITEKIPVGRLFKGLKLGDNFFKLLGEQLIIENATEQVATAWQDANEWLFLHPEKTLDDYLNERPNAALQTAIATTTATLLQTTVARTVSGMSQSLQKGKAASAFSDKLAHTKDLLDQSTTLPRDPEALMDHFAKVVEAGNNNIYLSIDGIDELSQKMEMAPVDVAGKLGIREQYEKNFLRGGDIAISAKTLGEFMLSDDWNVLAKHLRDGTDAFTQQEADDYVKLGIKADLDAILGKTDPEEAFSAWHGSKYLFDYFKLKGTALTGEGAQSFGPGIYIGEAKAIGRHYKSLDVELDWSKLPPDLEQEYGKEYERLTKELHGVNDTMDKELATEKEELAKELKIQYPEMSDQEIEARVTNTRSKVDQAARYRELSHNIYRQRDKIERDVFRKLKDRTGFLYKVKVTGNKDKDFIQWDLPASEQPPKVRKMMQDIKWQDPFTGKIGSLEDHLISRFGGIDPEGALNFVQLPQDIQDKYKDDLDFIELELEDMKSNDTYYDPETEINKYGLYTHKLSKGVQGLVAQRADIWDNIKKELRERKLDKEAALVNISGSQIWDLLKEYMRNQNLIEPELLNEQGGFIDDRYQDVLTPAEQEAYFTLMKRYGINGIRYLDQNSRGLSNKFTIIDASGNVVSGYYDTKEEAELEAASRMGLYPEIGKLTVKEDSAAEATYNYTIYDTDKLSIKKVNNQRIEAQAETSVQDAEQELGIDGLFLTAEEAGMDETEYSFYLAYLNKMHDKAVARMNEKLLKDAQRKTNKEYKKLRKDMQESVRESLSNTSVYQAVNSIQKDKLDREALIALLGSEKALKDLPKQHDGGVIYSAKGEKGLDPSVVAETHGFPSAFDLVYALATAKPFKQAVEETTDALMKKNYPDLSNQKERLDAAMEALTNDATTDVLVFELNKLRDMKAQEVADKAEGKEKKKRTLTLEQKAKMAEGQKAARIKAKVLKQAVKQLIASTPIGQINVQKFAKDAKKYGQLTSRALRDGDLDKAAEHKFKQIVNFMLSQQAYKIKSKLEKEQKYLAKWNNNKTAPQIGNSFVESARQLISNINLGARLSDKKKKDLQKWVDDMEAKGAIFQIPARLLADQKKHWSELTVSEWNTVVESVKNIEAQGRNIKLIGKVGKEVEFEHAKARLLATVEGVKDTSRAKWEKEGKVERTRDKTASKLAWADASLRKVESLLKYLDGHQAIGEFYKHMFQPVSEAQTEKLDMIQDKIQPMLDKIGKWPKMNRKRLERKLFVKELNQEMTYSQLLMLALNSGNMSNLSKVVEGHNSTLKKDRVTGKPIGYVWTNERVIDAMGNLSAVEANWVQGVWNYFESLRPAVEAVYEAENGYAAEKLEPTALRIGGVTLTGGYFPMMYKYSPARTDALSALQDQQVRASVYAGMTKERTGYVAPVDLDIQNLLPALEQNIHFITHYRAVRDNNKILSDSDLANAIRDKLGEEYLTQLKNWNEAVATGNRLGHTPTYVDKMVEMMRRNVTAAVLGASWTTGISQLFGYSSSVAVLGQGTKGESFSNWKGTKYMLIGLGKYWSKDAIHNVMSLSGEIRHRIANTDREMSEALRSIRYKQGLTGAASKTLHWWNNTTLKTISGLQTFCVDIPTWIGAFNMGLDEGMSSEDAVQFADHVVRTSQGTGHIKDLSAIQRQKGVMRALTMFSTYTLVLYNMEAETAGAIKRFNPTAFSRLMWAIAIPAMADALLRSSFPDDDEDEDYISWFLKKVGAYALRGIPVVGSGAASWMEGYQYRASPIETIPANFQKFAKTFQKWTEDELDSDWELVRDGIASFGLLLGFGGTVQAARVADALASDDPELNDFLIGPKDDE